MYLDSRMTHDIQKIFFSKEMGWNFEWKNVELWFFSPQLLARNVNFWLHQLEKKAAILYLKTSKSKGNCIGKISS